MNEKILERGEYTGRIEDRTFINGALITRTYYTPNSDPNWHYHENLHIVFVFQKGLSQKRNQSIYTDNRGQIVFFNAGEVHRFLCDDPITKSANIELSDDFLNKYDLMEEQMNLNIRNSEMGKSLMLSIQSELIHKEDHFEENILSLLLEFVSKPPKVSPENPKWVMKLWELLNDQWTENFTLAELGSLLQVHPVTISKSFRKYFGCSYGEYRRKQRVERSINMIKNTKLSLTQIAHQCGFSDQSHFIRNFKEYTSLLPNTYRKL